jgi:hypothetical protein
MQENEQVEQSDPELHEEIDKATNEFKNNKSASQF